MRTWALWLRLLWRGLILLVSRRTVAAMKRLPDEARNPVNRDVLAFLGRQARPTDRRPSGLEIDEYQLHTHPDLTERLAEAGAGLDAPMMAAYGVPVLVHPNGTIFAVAYSMSTLLYRLPAALHSRVVPSQWTLDVGEEWVAADAWLTNLPRQEGTERVREWCGWAYEHAAHLVGDGRH